MPPLTGQIIVTTINGMLYEWDETKRATNLAKHGLDFTLAEEFSWPSALVIPDARQDYGEARYFAIGELAGRLHVLIFTPRGDRVRIIGLRKANAREVKLYETQT